MLLKIFLFASLLIFSTFIKIRDPAIEEGAYRAEIARRLLCDRMRSAPPVNITVLHVRHLSTICIVSVLQVGHGRIENDFMLKSIHSTAPRRARTALALW